MLSEKELAVILESPRWSARWWMPMCLQMDEKRGIVVISKGRLANWIYYAYQCTIAYHTAFAGYRVLQSDRFSLELNLLYLTFFFTELQGFLIHMGFLIWRHPLVELHNKMLYMHRQLPPNPSGKRERLISGLESGYKWMVIGAVLPLYTGVEALYIWSIDGGWLWIGFVVVIFGVHFPCCYAIGAHLQMIMFLYSTLVSDTLRRPLLRDHKDLTLYRALCIVTTMFNNSYSYSTVPVVKYVISFTVMGALVGAIRLGSTSALVCVGILALGLYFLIMLALGTWASSAVWAKSTEYVWNWRHGYPDDGNENGGDGDGGAVVTRGAPPVRGSYDRRVGDSLRPVTFGVAGMYYMEREAKMTFLDFLLNGTLSMLIAFK